MQIMCQQQMIEAQEGLEVVGSSHQNLVRLTHSLHAEVQVRGAAIVGYHAGRARGVMQCRCRDRDWRLWSVVSVSVPLGSARESSLGVEVIARSGSHRWWESAMARRSQMPPGW